MNTITRRSTLAVAAAFLSTGLAACSEGAAQQVLPPPSKATETQESSSPCPDYLEGWERAHCSTRR